MKLNNLLVIFLFSFVFLPAATAQVGIGTTLPDPSSMMDISSTSRGLLAPRMTTAERTAINEPAESLLVYDTTESAFYYYDTNIPAWVKLHGGAGGPFEYRDNWKLIKKVEDLQPELDAGGGSEYLLDENIMYEINGMIILSHPINLNDAYLTGQDSGEDILVKAHAGPMFQGMGGGTIQKLVLTSHPAVPVGSIFSMDASASTEDTTFLLFRDCIVKDNASVGTITGFDLVFFSIIQFLGNADGITYSNIGSLLLQNQGWSSGGGTYEKLTGAFGLFQKASGFSVANGTTVAFDVSANPVIMTKAVMLGTVFTGTSTQFIKPYTTGTAHTYEDYNFTRVWTVNCPGIVAESDSEAFGNVYLTTPIQTNFTAANEAKKVKGTTTSVKHFRTGTDGESNRIIYLGSAKRQFFISATIALFADNKKLFTFYVAKNGVAIPSTMITTNVVGNSDVRTIAFTGTVDLAPDDYIEIYATNATASSWLEVSALNMLIY